VRVARGATAPGLRPLDGAGAPALQRGTLAEQACRIPILDNEGG
jgi:hypothetical protein